MTFREQGDTVLRMLAGRNAGWLRTGFNAPDGGKLAFCSHLQGVLKQQGAMGSISSWIAWMLFDALDFFALYSLASLPASNGQFGRGAAREALVEIRPRRQTGTLKEGCV